jgi:LPXTG-motif cell wall-anchored protein
MTGETWIYIIIGTVLLIFAWIYFGRKKYYKDYLKRKRHE